MLIFMIDPEKEIRMFNMRGDRANCHDVLSCVGGTKMNTGELYHFVPLVSRSET